MNFNQLNGPEGVFGVKKKFKNVDFAQASLRSQTTNGARADTVQTIWSKLFSRITKVHNFFY